MQWTFFKVIKIIWVSAGILFTTWLFYSMQSKGVSSAYLQSDDLITFEDNDDFYAFKPTTSYDQVFIFYPGALVHPNAYIPLCRKIAEKNIKVYLIKMPWRLAIKGYKKPLDLGILSDSTKTYVLAGHSQGAKMAAQFVFENKNAIDKLVLIASTHPRDISLADMSIPILKIYGSHDGVADETSIMDNKSKLPESTKFVRIEGANHAQFGYYGFQLGDNTATISREEQHAETIKSILNFIMD
jgi:Alpha/beta hydrolase family